MAPEWQRRKVVGARDKFLSRRRSQPQALSSFRLLRAVVGIGTPFRAAFLCLSVDVGLGREWGGELCILRCRVSHFDDYGNINKLFIKWDCVTVWADAIWLQQLATCVALSAAFVKKGHSCKICIAVRGENREATCNQSAHKQVVFTIVSRPSMRALACRDW